MSRRPPASCDVRCTTAVLTQIRLKFFCFPIENGESSPQDYYVSGSSDSCEYEITWPSIYGCPVCDPSVSLQRPSDCIPDPSGSTSTLPDLSTILLASVQSLCQAFTMAAVGVYLKRRGFLTDATSKVLGKITLQASIPALLFTSILACNQNWSSEPCPSMQHYMSSGWPLLLLPVVNVSVGTCLGYLVTKIAPPHHDFKRAVVAAVALGNSTGLPIVLLSVVHTSFSPVSHLGSINPVMFLSIYLLVYPVVQWSFGTFLLAKPTSQTPPNREGTLLSNMELGSEAPTGEDVQRGGDTDDKDDGKKTRRGRLQDMATALRKAVGTVVQPPVVAAIAGILVSFTPARGWFVDIVDRDNDAPLQGLFNALDKVGATAVPLNMICLGCAVAHGVKWRAVPLRTNLLIATTKLILMPAFGVATALLLDRLGFRILDNMEDSFYLVVMVVTSTPTANNVLVMTQQAGQNVEAMAACIITQYLFAPLTLTAGIAAFITIVTRL